MQAQEPRRALRDGHHFRDGERRRIAGEDCFRIHDLVDFRKELPLALEILDDRLNHQIALGEIFESYRGLQAPQRRRGLISRKRSFFRQLLQGPFDRGQTLVQQLLGNFPNHGRKPRRRRNLSNP